MANAFSLRRSTPPPDGEASFIYDLGGSTTVAPETGFIASAWVRVPVAESITPPYSRGNQYPFYVIGDAGSGNEWGCWCVANNLNVPASDSYPEDVYYNANTMIGAKRGSDSHDTGFGDYSWYLATGHTAQQVLGWMFAAWWFQVTASALVIHQFLRHPDGVNYEWGAVHKEPTGTPGAFAAGSTTLTFTEARAMLAADGWTTEQQNGWVPSGLIKSISCAVDSGDWNRLAIWPQSTLPSLAVIEEIATGVRPKTDAYVFANGLWVSGAYDLTDRSGNARNPTSVISTGLSQGLEQLYDDPSGPAVGTASDTLPIWAAAAGTNGSGGGSALGTATRLQNIGLYRACPLTPSAGLTMTFWVRPPYNGWGAAAGICNEGFAIAGMVLIYDADTLQFNWNLNNEYLINVSEMTDWIGVALIWGTNGQVAIHITADGQSFGYTYSGTADTPTDIEFAFGVLSNLLIPDMTMQYARIHDQALTTAQALAELNSAEPVIAPWAHWPLNYSSTQSEILQDTSGNARHLSVRGGGTLTDSGYTAPAKGGAPEVIAVDHLLMACGF